MLDSSSLRRLGESPAEVAAQLKSALTDFEAALAQTRDRWDVPVFRVAPSPDFSLTWSPAQQAEHVLKATISFSKLVYVLGGDKPLPAVPRGRGPLSPEGRRVSPAGFLPDGGLTWEDWQAKWSEINGRFLSEVERVDPVSTRVFWHPYLGDLGALDWARVAALHTRSHRQQLGVSG